jgi:hypothetical protein
MPGGWVPLQAAIRAAGPVGWWQFSELLPGSPVTAGSQDPQNIAFDGSASGNLNPGVIPNPNGNNLQYGSAVIGNAFEPNTSVGSNAQTAALFPSTATTSLANIITGGSAQPPILQPTAAISVGAQLTPNVMTTGSVKQVLMCYGSDASSLAAYNLYHLGSTATNHVFAFSVNIGGTLRTATASLPALVVGTAYFALGTYDGTAVRIYVNGVLEGTTTITGAISYASLGGFGLAMGNDPSNSDANLQGAMGVAAIYNYALTQTQITYLARQGFTYLPFPWRH